eukprot:tig00000093_g3558.t1
MIQGASSSDGSQLSADANDSIGECLARAGATWKSRPAMNTMRLRHEKCRYFLVLGRPTTGGSPAGRASSIHDVQARPFTSAAALGGNHTQRHSEADLAVPHRAGGAWAALLLGM